MFLRECTNVQYACLAPPLPRVNVACSRSLAPGRRRESPTLPPRRLGVRVLRWCPGMDPRRMRVAIETSPRRHQHDQRSLRRRHGTGSNSRAGRARRRAARRFTTGGTGALCAARTSGCRTGARRSCNASCRPRDSRSTRCQKQSHGGCGTAGRTATSSSSSRGRDRARDSGRACRGCSCSGTRSRRRRSGT